MASEASGKYSAPTPDMIRMAEKQIEQRQRVVEYDTKEFTVELLAEKFAPEAKGEASPDADIFVPNYQREFSWDEARQSRFIESLIMGLPIPFLFFADKDDGRLEVVDGRQRLQTCVNFLRGELVLIGCERLTELDGFKFQDLPKSQQRRFKNRSIRAITLSRNAHEDDRRDLFDRINTGPLIAEPAEVRRGSLPGPVTDLIGVLSKDARFARLCPLTTASRRTAVDEELVTRYFVFAANFESDLPNYKDRVADYMYDWLRTINPMAKDDALIVQSLQDEFELMLSFVERHFPFGFSKNKTSTSTPSVRFDAIAVGVTAALREAPDLASQQEVDMRWLASDNFFEFTTSNAANVRSRIVRRIGFVKRSLLESRRG